MWKKIEDNVWWLILILIGAALFWLKLYIVLGIYIAAMLILFFVGLLLCSNTRTYPYDYIFHLKPYISWFKDRGFNIIRYVDPGTKYPGVELAVIDNEGNIDKTAGRIAIMLKYKWWSSHRTKIEIILSNEEKLIFPVEQSKEKIKEQLDSNFGDNRIMPQ